MQSLLPCGFEPNDIGCFHVGRHALKNCESKPGWIATAQEAITTVTASSIVEPSAKQVVLAIR